MNTKSQCAAILRTFKNKWFSNAIAWDHLRITSLHRRLSDLECQGYLIQRKWHPSRKFKVYRVIGTVA